MSLLSFPLAKYFAGLYNPGHSLRTQDLDEYLTSEIDKNNKIFSEKDGTLQPIVNLLIKEAEKSFFLSLNNYIRGLEVLGKSSGNWSHITFYYSTFYSAKAILALFGGWNKDHEDKNWAMQVISPQSQNLVLKTIQWKYKGKFRHSHKAFWSYYYESIKDISPNIRPEFSPALVPVNDDVFWMTKTRNRLNYTINDAININSHVYKHLGSTKFPSCLPSEIYTQYNQAKHFILLAKFLLDDFKINTNAFDCIQNGANRTVIIKDYLYELQNIDLNEFNLKSEII